MSAIALYKALIEANVSEEIAERAVEGLAGVGDAATKAGVAGLRTEIAELEVRLVKLFFAALFASSGLTIAAVGLMIKFL